MGRRATGLTLRREAAKWFPRVIPRTLRLPALAAGAPRDSPSSAPGVGSISHVAGVFFQKETGTRFQFIPYRGVNLAQRDLIGGEIDLLFDQAVNAVPNVRAGKIKAYAVTAKTRLASAPDIPQWTLWNALWAPKGTPKEVILKVNAAAVDSLADATVRNRLRDLGLDVPVRDQQTPEALATFHKAEVEKWCPVMREANIRAE